MLEASESTNKSHAPQPLWLGIHFPRCVSPTETLRLPPCGLIRPSKQAWATESNLLSILRHKYILDPPPAQACRLPLPRGSIFPSRLLTQTATSFWVRICNVKSSGLFYLHGRNKLSMKVFTMTLGMRANTSWWKRAGTHLSCPCRPARLAPGRGQGAGAPRPRRLCNGGARHGSARSRPLIGTRLQPPRSVTWGGGRFGFDLITFPMAGAGRPLPQQQQPGGLLPVGTRRLRLKCPRGECSPGVLPSTWTGHVSENQPGEPREDRATRRGRRPSPRPRGPPRPRAAPRGDRRTAPA